MHLTIQAGTNVRDQSSHSDIWPWSLIECTFWIRQRSPRVVKSAHCHNFRPKTIIASSFKKTYSYLAQWLNRSSICRIESRNGHKSEFRAGQRFISTGRDTFYKHCGEILTQNDKDCISSSSPLQSGLIFCKIANNYRDGGFGRCLAFTPPVLLR